MGLNSTPDSSTSFSCRCMTSNVIDCLWDEKLALKSGIEFMTTISGQCVRGLSLSSDQHIKQTILYVLLCQILETDVSLPLCHFNVSKTVKCFCMFYNNSLHSTHFIRIMSHMSDLSTASSFTVYVYARS